MSLKQAINPTERKLRGIIATHLLHSVPNHSIPSLRDSLDLQRPLLMDTQVQQYLLELGTSLDQFLRAQTIQDRIRGMVSDNLRGRTHCKPLVLVSFGFESNTVATKFWNRWKGTKKRWVSFTNILEDLVPRSDVNSLALAYLRDMICAKRVHLWDFDPVRIAQRKKLFQPLRCTMKSVIKCILPMKARPISTKSVGSGLSVLKTPWFVIQTDGTDFDALARYISGRQCGYYIVFTKHNNRELFFVVSTCPIDYTYTETSK